jgi:transcriptional regulator with XRE-family HTH domain
VDQDPAIGKSIARLRRLARLTQQDIAVSLSLTRGAVAQWEAGLSDPPARRLPALAQLLNCTIQQLFEG